LKKVLEEDVAVVPSVLPPSVFTDWEAIRQIREVFFGSIEDIIKILEHGDFETMHEQLESFLVRLRSYHEAFRMAKVNDLAHDLDGLVLPITGNLELWRAGIIDAQVLSLRIQRQLFFLKLLSEKRAAESLRLFHVLNALGGMAQVHSSEISVGVPDAAEPKELARALYNLIRNALNNGAKNVEVWVVPGREFSLQKFVGGFVNEHEFARWQSSSGWGILVQDDGLGVEQGIDLVQEGIKRNGDAPHGNGVRIAHESAERCGAWLWQLNSGPQPEGQASGLAWLIAFPGEAQAEPQGKE
jgi:signal transduction histidine kinase